MIYIGIKGKQNKDTSVSPVAELQQILITRRFSSMKVSVIVTCNTFESDGTYLYNHGLPMIRKLLWSKDYGWCVTLPNTEVLLIIGQDSQAMNLIKASRVTWFHTLIGKILKSYGRPKKSISATYVQHRDLFLIYVRPSKLELKKG